ncbi:hypothetical protein ACQKFM_21110 [Paenibacillus xylanexedens]|uniref:hypothetical protein n=1 Tax=Paenibacillus xylanexedens TaxID=528191 RepID=UPI003D04DC5C
MGEVDMAWILYVAVSFVGVVIVTWMLQTITGLTMELSVEILILIALGFICKIVTEVHKEQLQSKRNSND